MRRAATAKAAIIDTSSFTLEKHHRYKWPLVRQRLEAAGLGAQIQSAELLQIKDAHRSHNAEYCRMFLENKLSDKAMQRIGIAWSQSLVDRVLNVTGSTAKAAKMIVKASDGPIGIAIVGGGAHHAHADFGSGYCVFNDLTIAASILSDAGKRVLILDLDVHHGDGTATIAKSDNVWITDVYCRSNFPFRKFPEKVNLAVELADGLSDSAYLRAVENALIETRNQFGDFDCVLYQAGVDPLKSDRLGRLHVSMEGLQERDRMVNQFIGSNVSVISTCGGGYARHDDDEALELVVEAHTNQISILLERFL